MILLPPYLYNNPLKVVGPSTSESKSRKESGSVSWSRSRSLYWSDSNYDFISASRAKLSRPISTSGKEFVFGSESSKIIGLTDVEAIIKKVIEE